MLNNYFANEDSRMPDWDLARLVRRCLSALAVGISTVCVSGCGTATTPTDETASNAIHADQASEDRDAKATRLTRLFWQDHDSATVRAGDLVKKGQGYEVQSLTVSDLPDLDVDQNNLVQMVVVDGSLFVGVRDNADGEKLSGWIQVNTGVSEEDHGDHSHWHYKSSPAVSSHQLDAEQGNPAHVYRYGKAVYLANDKKNGFTMLQPAPTSGEDQQNMPVTRFYSGGGGHITLAAVGERIAYSTWIDGGGENAGRVDVVDLRAESDPLKYSFNLPSGGIHGATACGNRVFFAPSDGVCWVDCDFDFARDSDSVEVHHLPLGEAGEAPPYRTGAFESFQNHVLCIANNKVDDPAVCVINGTVPNPKVTRIPCSDLGGLQLSTVHAYSIGRDPYAFAFAEGEGQEEKLLVFELDPNGDRDFGDAVLKDSIVVGKSQIEGHYGHHGLAFVPGGKIAVVSNPGDQTLTVVDLKAMQSVQTIEVGGQPTHLISIGGKP